MILLAGYLGLQYLPASWTRPYEMILRFVCPLLTLLEGLAAMTLILSSGQLWSESLQGQGRLVQILVLFGCSFIYFSSFGIIGYFYYAGLIKTVVAATLLAVVATLLIILSVGTVIAEHGIITDSSLLTLYLTYNLWLITRASGHLPVTVDRPSLLFKLTLQQLSLKTIPTLSLSSLLMAILSIFSVEIVAGLLIQMSIFLVTAMLYRRSLELYDEDRESSPSYWIVGILWPCFGKCLMVTAYTFSWLNSTDQTSPMIYLDPILWRWINILLCILVYVYHLLYDPDGEQYDHLKID